MSFEGLKDLTGKVFAGLIFGGALTFCFLSYSAIKQAQKEKFHNMLNQGITHQYIDTDQDGRYDFYRFLQRRKERTVQYIDCRLVSDSEVSIDRTESAPIYGESTREQCLRMYRVGDFEFYTLKDEKLVRDNLDEK
jgi:hypothetical protein